MNLLQPAAEIAQIVSAIVSIVAIVVAFIIGLRTLREYRAARLQDVRPFLVFEGGAQKVACELKQLDGIPGIDFGYASRLIAQHRPPGAMSIVPREFWGRLINHGNGSAINVIVTVVAENVVKAHERFSIDQARLSDFPYSLNLNRIPTGNIAPGKSGTFWRIPTPIFADFSGQLQELDGYVSIEYDDIYNTHFTTVQDITCFVRRPEGASEIDLTITTGEQRLRVP